MINISNLSLWPTKVRCQARRVGCQDYNGSLFSTFSTIALIRSQLLLPDPLDTCCRGALWSTKFYNFVSPLHTVPVEVYLHDTRHGSGGSGRGRGSSSGRGWYIVGVKEVVGKVVGSLW